MDFTAKIMWLMPISLCCVFFTYNLELDQYELFGSFEDFTMTELLPTNDVMFKMIFGNQKHSRVLIHFLNSVIKPVSPIKSVKIRKNELIQESISEKGVRLDIVGETDSGEILNIEMQRKDEKDMAARALFYWSRLFAGQLEVGERYHQLKRTISVNILDFTLFERDERYWRKGYIKDDYNNEAFTELLEIHFLELNKMRQVEDDSPITFWIEFFKNPYSEKVTSLCEFVPEIKEAKNIFEKAKADPEAQELMRVREKAIRDYSNDIACAKDEGKEEGLAEGLAKGKDEGLAEGELKKARETALSMISDGMPIEIISKYTGLSVEDIQGIQTKK